MTKKISMLKVFMVFLLFMTLLTVSPMFAGIEDVNTKTFDVKNGGKLIMDVERGSIKIIAESGSKMIIEVIKKAKTSDKAKAQKLFDNYKLVFKKSGNDVRIDGEYKKSLSRLWKSNKLNVKFIITLPKKYELDLNTSGGSISVTDLEGEVKTRTSGGSLKFDSVIGNVNGKTSGGSIKLKDCSGNVVVDTSGGSIHIGTVKGEVKAHTSGGGIYVEEVMGTISASTSGGSIKAYISKQPKADCSLKTSGGSISVSLATGIKFNLNAKTSGGGISTDFPIIIKGKLSRNKLKTAINGGGPELLLKTSGGSIRIKEIK